jgi:hypothetical protein
MRANVTCNLSGCGTAGRNKPTLDAARSVGLDLQSKTPHRRSRRVTLQMELQKLQQRSAVVEWHRKFEPVLIVWLAVEREPHGEDSGRP